MVLQRCRGYIAVPALDFIPDDDTGEGMEALGREDMAF
jgi:hypothetical protein